MPDMSFRLMIAVVCLVGLSACGSGYDGEQQWRFTTKKTHRQWGTVDAQRLYLAADDVYCLDIATGRLLWEYKTFATHASGPVVANGRVFFNCGGLHALDAETGELLWEFWTTQWAHVAPAADEQRVYVAAGDRLYCLDAASGERLWSVAGAAIEQAPVVAGEKVFFMAGQYLLCLDAATGQKRWRVACKTDRAQLAAAGDFVLSSCSDGTVRAHRVENGEIAWQFDTHTPLITHFTVCGRQVLISAGTLYSLKTESGELLWALEHDQVWLREAQVSGRYGYARGLRNEILCISLDDGALVRRLRLPAGGRLVTDSSGTGPVFFPAGGSRMVRCLVISPQ